LTNAHFHRFLTLASLAINTCLPTTRFSIEECSELVCRAVRRGPGGSIRYAEAIVMREPNNVLVIDMDAFAETVPASDIIATADRLHDIVRREFEATVNDPVIHYMRTGELQT
jgi:hypothetical protein